MNDTCNAGHPRTPENIKTYTYPSRSARPGAKDRTITVCVPCSRAYAKSYQSKRPRVKKKRRVLPLHVKLFKQAYHNSLTGCIVWCGHTNKKGYGYIHHDDAWPYVHRLAYEYWVGPIPDGMTVDHLCWNVRCMAPDHFELVTLAENTRRRLMRQ